MDDGFLPFLIGLLCCMQAQDKSDSPPWILENSGIITKQYFITSKSRFHRLLRFQNLTYGSLRITSWWSTMILYTR